MDIHSCCFFSFPKERLENNYILYYHKIVKENVERIRSKIVLAGINHTQFVKDVSIDHEIDVGQVLSSVYNALSEKGYNPVSQIVGYIMSGDPTYITNHNGARSMIMKVERDEILEELVENYIDTKLSPKEKR